MKIPTNVDLALLIVCVMKSPKTNVMDVYLMMDSYSVKNQTPAPLVVLQTVSNVLQPLELVSYVLLDLF